MGPTVLLPFRRKACWGFFRPSAGFEPANLGTKGQHATPKPPKPLIHTLYILFPVWLKFIIGNLILVLLNVCEFCENRIGKGEWVLLTRANEVTFVRAYCGTVWHLESNRRLCKGCVLVTYCTICCLVLSTSVGNILSCLQPTLCLPNCMFRFSRIQWI